jgi:mannose-6-phosphate isomerase-like protein (cupin superfamily)
LVREPDFFNVLTARYEPLEVDIFRGSGAEARILFESVDGRHLVVASRYPHGVRFRYGGSVHYREAFFVVRGSGTRSFANGSSVAMTEGDLIYVRAGVEIDYAYCPGFIDVAFFWSDAAPLSASICEGIINRGLSG